MFLAFSLYEYDRRNMSLHESWEITTRHLNRARTSLPEIGSADDADFQELLSHNELELAMTILADVAAEMECDETFWLAMRDAASNMELRDWVDLFNARIHS